jgi:hypothetical protein
MRKLWALFKIKCILYLEKTCFLIIFLSTLSSFLLCNSIQRMICRALVRAPTKKLITQNEKEMRKIWISVQLKLNVRE